MLTLRLTQETIKENQYRARLRLEGDGLPQEAVANYFNPFLSQITRFYFANDLKSIAFRSIF